MNPPCFLRSNPTFVFGKFVFTCSLLVQMLKGSMYYIGPKIPTNVSFENPKSRQERYLLLFHLFFSPILSTHFTNSPTPCHYPDQALRPTHKTNTLYHALANPNTPPVFPFRPYPSSRFPLRPCTCTSPPRTGVWSLASLSSWKWILSPANFGRTCFDGKCAKGDGYGRWPYYAHMGSTSNKFMRPNGWRAMCVERERERQWANESCSVGEWRW